MTDDKHAEEDRLVGVFVEFQRSWLDYWAAYVELQKQLYESLRAGREVSWLAATDNEKINEINVAQRELFATMPRRMDYMPLGQVNRSLDSAMGKLDELEKALSSEEAKCKKLLDAIQVLRQGMEKTRAGLKAKH